MAQSDARPAGDQEVAGSVIAGSDHRRVRQHSLVDIDHEKSKKHLVPVTRNTYFTHNLHGRFHIPPFPGLYYIKYPFYIEKFICEKLP